MRPRYCVTVLSLLVIPAVAARAQQPDTAARRDSAARTPAWSAALVLPGSPADDARRTRQLLDGEPTAGTLIRSAGTLSGRPSALAPAPGGVRAAALGPFVQLAHNSTLPFSLNDGSMWAGRGLSYRVTGGVALERGGLAVVLAPEVTYAQNRQVYVIPSGDTTRSMFASPWFSGTYSADLPLRFGNQDLRMVTLGQSRIEYTYRGVASAGASTEDQWWGPGIHNALVLSSNGPGIPHVFLRTARPIRTRIGDVEARWILGGLTESIYFDRDAGNDVRALSAAAATLRLAVEPGLTIGAARAVYVAVDGASQVPTRLFDVFERWGQTSDDPVAREGDPSEQLLSLFARWVFPANGLELYGEWARQELPSSIRDLLVAPQESQAYTVGMQLARPALGGAFRGRVEATVLEQTPDNREGSVQSFYLSRYTRQGYTQRGQSIGAGIGPGSSSQWLAVDYLRPRWNVGGEVARIRWNEDAYAQQETGVQRFAHDVSLLATVRGGVELRGVRMHAALTREHRLNYLFRNFYAGTYPDARYDEHNTSLRLTAEVAP